MIVNVLYVSRCCNIILIYCVVLSVSWSPKWCDHNNNNNMIMKYVLFWHACEAKHIYNGSSTPQPSQCIYNILLRCNTISNFYHSPAKNTIRMLIFFFLCPRKHDSISLRNIFLYVGLNYYSLRNSRVVLYLLYSYPDYLVFFFGGGGWIVVRKRLNPLVPH